jgi:uncharacterized protein (TIGR02996 family)
MSDDESALLNAIDADRDADLPRLVYADWLEEQGRELRAEFIRIQCEIAKLEVGPRDVIDQNVHLWRRQQELLDDFRDEIQSGAAYHADLYTSVAFRRGFLDDIRLHPDDFRKLTKPLIALRPLPDSIVIESGNGFVESRHAYTNEAHRLVTGLEFYSRGDEDDYKCKFDMSIAIWSRLRTLAMTGGAYVMRDQPLSVTARRMPALKSLNLAHNDVHTVEVLEMLDAGILQRLTHISLIENMIDDQAAVELADRLGDSPHLNELDLRRNGITEVGQRALLARLGSKVILF